MGWFTAQLIGYFLNFDGCGEGGDGARDMYGLASRKDARGLETKKTPR